MSKQRISVTQEDIDFGQRGKCYACPVAWAVGRCWPREDPDIPVIAGVVTTGRDLCIDVAGLVLPAPDGVAEFVHRFDSGKTVEPFEFELDLPEGGGS